MQVSQRVAAVQQHSLVAQGLRTVQGAEAKRPPRYLQVSGRVGGQQQEVAAGRTGLVELAGGVQVTGTEAQGHRHRQACLQFPRQARRRRAVGDAIQVAQDGDVVAGRQPGEETRRRAIGQFIQEEVADRTLTMLAGAMEELTVGLPWRLDTDVGPVIDAEARDMLTAHAGRLSADYSLIAETPVPDDLPEGCWFAPRAFEIDRLEVLEREVFGPILHVIRYDGDHLDRVIDAVTGTGYGLTLGIHSRVESTIAQIRARARVGNIYVNRNMIGAVVGSQPFGGLGLSGTGPKAGGPRYLHRFATERSLCVNTTAQGGNTSLMSLDEG